MVDITEVRFYPYSGQNSSLVAFLSITIEDILVIKGIKVIEGKKGLFVAMPSVEGKDDEKYYDQVFFLDDDSKREFQEIILDQYDDFLKENEKENKKSSKSKSGKRSK